MTLFNIIWYDTYNIIWYDIYNIIMKYIIDIKYWMVEFY